MIETGFQRIELMNSVRDYAESKRYRNRRLMVLMLLLLTVALGAITAVRFLAPKSLAYAPFFGIGVVALCCIPVLIWNYPRAGLYLLVLSACLFMQIPMNMNRDPFAWVPLFWNFNQAWAFFTGSTSLEFLHVNLGELFMAMTFLFWLMRQITLRQLHWNPGAFFGWFALYLAWCVFGFINGLEKGGDITTALWEVRAQAYFALAYLLATNLITDRKHALTLMWVMLIGIGAKTIVGTVNFAKNPNVSADEGVLSHEDSLLCNIVLFGALLYTIAQVDPKLKWGFIAFVPTALITDLANGRRAAIAAFIVAFPIVIAMSAVLLRERRAALIRFLVAFAFISAIYLPIAWHGQGPWALPARAIRSRTSPDGRDAASDYYRLSENMNLSLTRDTSPWLGYGYGRPYVVAFTQFGRFDPFMNVLPHNGILWIWMRLGNIGFVLFWMFVATVLIRGPQLLKAIRDPRLQVIGILVIAEFLMHLIYGEYDLTFANYRPMILTGTLLGVLAVLPRLVELKQQEREALGLSRASQGEGDELVVREVDEVDEEESEPPVDWRRRGLPGFGRGRNWMRGPDW